MHREILREHVHRAILHRAAAGHDPGVIPIAGYQRVRLHERAGVQQLRHPFTGGQLASRALLCDSFRVSLQDALLFRQHLLQVLLTHVQNSLHVMPLSGREKLRLQSSPTFLILHVPPISCCPEKFCGFSEESGRIFVKIVRTVEISSKNAPDRKREVRIILPSAQMVTPLQRLDRCRLHGSPVSAQCVLMFHSPHPTSRFSPADAPSR